MNLDTQTLVHIGTELVIIGGVVYWTNRRIGSLEARIDDLQKKLIQYEDLLGRQQQILSMHENILSRLGVRPPPPQHSSAQTPRPAPVPPPQNPTPGGVEVRRQQPQPRVEELPDDQPDINPEELDEMLSDELKDLNRPSSIEVQITEVPESPIQRKKSRLKKRSGRKTTRLNSSPRLETNGVQQ